jgi:hypothetical protein
LENEIVGTKGYVIYDWGGNGANLMNVLAPVTISTSSGWGHLSYLKRQYRVDNQLGTDQGLFANPVGLINVGVTDTNFHYLTVVSPAQFNDTRNFTMSLTSTNGGTVKYAVNESPGYSHVFQFRFKGNVTLTADAAGGKGGIVQSIFVDDAPASFSIESSTNLEPPSLLHILKIGK